MHTDILGALPETPHRNKHILATHDAFSKWLIATPMPDQKAATVSSCFVRDVVCQHGVPNYVVTDNGRQLTGTIFEDMAKIFVFKHRTITPYHAQANGAIERQNRSIANMLSACLNSQGNDWDEYLSLVVMSFNTAVQASTNRSPFSLLHYRDCTLPSDLSLGIDTRKLAPTTAHFCKSKPRAFGRLGK